MKYPIIIAEAGVNHNGDMQLAKQLVATAKEAGADYVKFQTFKAENVMSRFAVQAEYQKTNTGIVESQIEMVRKFELSVEQTIGIMNYCKEVGIKFLSSPFDNGSIMDLYNMGLRIIKIPSGEITNLPYLRIIGALNIELIISSGMSTLGEIETALKILNDAGTPTENITVLHCNTDYPTAFSDVNLKAMQTIRDAFHVKVGYSDHTPGVEVSVAAVALGATVIEKHFTTDRNLPGPDQKASLEPDELKLLVSSCRNVFDALGNGIKVPSAAESKNIVIARKSIHLTKNLAAGHVITMDDITIKRPGDGISPLLIDTVIGRALKQNVGEDRMLSYTDLL